MLDKLGSKHNAPQKSVRFMESQALVLSEPNNDEDFEISCDSFTPKLETVETVQYKDPSHRSKEAIAPPSSLVRPNYEDLLRRVSVVIHQHIRKCEAKLASSNSENTDKGPFNVNRLKDFTEEKFVSPQYIYHFVRMPLVRTGFCYSLHKVQQECNPPAPNEIYLFLRTLFLKAQLSAECSIVCLIYVERLMEYAKVPLVASTWRPCLLCGLLLASKVWQDLR
jgi:hypothetical protein